MKNNIEYYRHSAVSDQHPKFKMLRNRYGWEGEGKFWALNNRIAQAENCCLNITKKYNKASIANDLGFKIDEFDEYIQFLIGDCELVIQTEEGLTTDTIQENFLNVSEKRMRNKIGYQNRQKKGMSEDLSGGDPDESENQHAKTENQPDELIQSKVKESKVKESKVNKKVILEIVSSVLNDLNTRLNLKKGFSCKSVNNSSKIIARLNEGYKLEDFILVNQKKCKQWIDDPEMAQYLRPETLYSNKFEGYLNQIEVKIVKQVDPKYQTADERRRVNNKKVFEQTLQEIEDVHQNGGADNRGGVIGKEEKGNSGFFSQLRRELPQGDNAGIEPNLDRKFKSP